MMIAAAYCVINTGRWEVGGGRREAGGGRWEVGGGRQARRREVGGGRWEVRFGAVPNTSVRFDTGAGGSIRYSVKVLLQRPWLRLESPRPKHQALSSKGLGFRV